MYPERNVNAGLRLAAMLLDHIFMTIIAMIFFIPAMTREFANGFSESPQPDLTGFNGPLFYVGLFGFALYFCKDCVNGRSIAKRLLKLQLVDNKTGEVASPLQCFVRNIFCVLWPIEVIVALVNPARRIGDRVAGTKLEYFDPVSVDQPKFKFIKLLIPLVLSFGFWLLLLFAFSGGNSFRKAPQFVERSYNDKESKALERLYADSMGTALTANVKVYDKTEGYKEKYIHIVYRLKQNFLDTPESEAALKATTMKHLYTMFPENSFTGEASYIYREGNFIKSSGNSIGKNLWLEK